MGPVPMKTIVKKTLEGIARAQEDYKNWTGGCWLWEAAEYFVTSYIAREIATVEGYTYYLTLESGVKGTIDYAGGRRGRPPSALRQNGKFDILLWWGGYRPRAVIEVKRHAFHFSTIKADVDRICKVLSQPRLPNSFQCGLVVFYASKYLEGRLNEVKSWLNDRLEGMRSSTEDFVDERGLRLDWSAWSMEREEDSAWTAVVARINRQVVAGTDPSAAPRPG